MDGLFETIDPAAELLEVPTDTAAALELLEDPAAVDVDALAHLVKLAARRRLEGIHAA